MSKLVIVTGAGQGIGEGLPVVWSKMITPLRWQTLMMRLRNRWLRI